jgi:flavoprotein
MEEEEEEEDVNIFVNVFNKCRLFFSIIWNTCYNNCASHAIDKVGMRISKVSCSQCFIFVPENTITPYEEVYVAFTEFSIAYSEGSYSYPAQSKTTH